MVNGSAPGSAGATEAPGVAEAAPCSRRASSAGLRGAQDLAVSALRRECDRGVIIVIANVSLAVAVTLDPPPLRYHGYSYATWLANSIQLFLPIHNPRPRWQMLHAGVAGMGASVAVVSLFPPVVNACELLQGME